MYFRKAIIAFSFVIAITDISATTIDNNQLDSIGLPVLRIETVNGEIPTCDYVEHPPYGMGTTITNMTKVPGRLTISKSGQVVYDSGDYIEKESGITIRIRGNTSAYTDKKPYKIKLQKKADLLQRGEDSIYKDKNWILLKDEALYNKIGFKVNELMEMQWTPAYEYVNVVLNGEYMGLYMLVESVKRNTDCRLNVDKTGFVFEFDPYWWNTDLYVKSWEFYPPNLMNYTFKYPDPEEISEEQLDYFIGMTDRLEKSVVNGSYGKYIDTKSFASWLLAQDILGNWDGGGSNYFLTKYDNTDRSKVMMGCLWDFSGIMFMKDRWSNNHSGWFYYIYLMKDESFISEYKKRWYEISPILFEAMQNWLNNYATSQEAADLNKSLELDRIRWSANHDDIYESIDYAIDWFISRKTWLTDAIDGMSGIHDVKIKPEYDYYYDLNGRRKSTPSKGFIINNGKIWIK